MHTIHRFKSLHQRSASTLHWQKSTKDDQVFNVHPFTRQRIKKNFCLGHSSRNQSLILTNQKTPYKAVASIAPQSAAFYCIIHELKPRGLACSQWHSILRSKHFMPHRNHVQSYLKTRKWVKLSASTMFHFFAW